MLVDSHCHLDFPDLASELDAIVARAEAAGIGRIVTIGTRVRQHHQVVAIARRFPRSSARSGPILTTRMRNSDVTSAELVARTRRSEGRRHRRSRASTTITTTRPRAAQEQGFRTHIAAARETGLPLVIHSREADADMAAHSRGRSREGSLPGRAALLHRRPRAGIRRGCARTCYVSFSGMLTFKKFARAARRSPARCRPTGCWSRPMRLTLRPAAIAASATSRPTSVETAKVLAEDARRLGGDDRAPDHGEFLPAVRQGSGAGDRAPHDA